MTTYRFLLLAVLAIGTVSSEMSACDSCEYLVRYFVSAQQNRNQMDMVKVTLINMCEGTSHQADCFKTVEKLDFIAQKLVPYLKDTKAVCSKLQMCGESPSEIARLATLFVRKYKADITNDNFARRLVCDECKSASSKFHDIFASEQNVHMAKSAVQHYFCRGAGKYNKACNLMADALVPELFEEVRGILSEGDAVCGDMQLCEASRKTFVAAQKPSKALNEIWKSLGSVKTENGEELMSCFECTLSTDALLEEFINKRQATADDLQKPICGKVTEAWTAGCNDFFHMYLSTVLYLTYNQFDGRGICTLMHTCEKKEAALDFNYSTSQTKLERCQKIEAFLAENAMYLQEHAAEGLATKVCGALPVAFNELCSRAAHRVTSKMFDRVGQIASSRTVCPLVV